MNVTNVSQPSNVFQNFIFNVNEEKQTGSITYNNRTYTISIKNASKKLDNDALNQMTKKVTLLLLNKGFFADPTYRKALIGSKSMEFTKLDSSRQTSIVRCEGQEYKQLLGVVNRTLHPVQSAPQIPSSQPVTTPQPTNAKLPTKADAVETDFRSQEKYNHVLDKIKSGFKAADTYSQVEDANVANPQEFEKCRKFLEKALSCLESNAPYKTGRERYKAYKNNLRQALASEYYKNNPNSYEARKLNALAYAEFATVDVQSFTESVATGIGLKGGFRAGRGKNPSPTLMHKFRRVISKKILTRFHKNVGNQESLGQRIKGEIKNGFDPSVQGNPPNVKFKMTSSDGRTITNVRTPTPTGKDGQVTPEFKAFLRHLKLQGKKYAMINLQNRTEAPRLKKIFGLDGEQIRSANLEALGNDPEFKDTLTVFTFDKNSTFFKQTVDKQEVKNYLKTLRPHIEKKKYRKFVHNINNREKRPHVADALTNIAKQHPNAPASPFTQTGEQFITQFMHNLTEKKSGFYVPETWQNNPEKMRGIENELKWVHQTFFGNEPLTLTNRQDFIEIAYVVLTDYILKETGAEYYNTSCKDCIDRGGGANWLMYAVMTLLEAADPDKAEDPALEARIHALPAKLQEDALWARKRRVVDERLERAQSAITHVVHKMEVNSTLAADIRQHLNVKSVIMPEDTNLKTKDRQFTAGITMPPI